MSRPRAKPKVLRHVYSVPEILEWADAHHARTGAWPIYRSGLVLGVLAENWRKVDNALRWGYRGLPGGSSLAQLLAEKRNVRNGAKLPPFRLEQILLWVDNHYKRMGIWPIAESGPIADAPGETWGAVDIALRNGDRGLDAGSSLARLLAHWRGHRNTQVLPPYTVREILEWADAHHMRTGTWPTYRSGPIAEAPGETWKAVHAALYSGGRGLPGLSSLAQVLAAHRGVTIATQLPPLTLPKMRMWARGHKRLTGSWPTSISGPIAGVPDMTWKKVYEALRVG